MLFEMGAKLSFFKRIFLSLRKYRHLVFTVTNLVSVSRAATLIGNDDIYPRDGKGRSQNFESDAMKSSQPLLLVESSILLVAQVGISTRGV